MSRNKQILKILQFIIDNLDYTIKVKNIVDNGDGTFTIETCDTFYITEGTQFDISGTTYTVDSFVFNESFTVTSATFPSVDNITLNPIHFYSGTLKDASGERGKVTSNGGLTPVPLVWSREPMALDVNRDFESPLWATASLELYVLTACDPSVWKNEDHYELAINPMYNITDRIYQFVDDRGDLFNEYLSERQIPRVFLGTEGSSGYGERLFDENLSGVQTNFDLEILNRALFECC